LMVKRSARTKSGPQEIWRMWNGVVFTSANLTYARWIIPPLLASTRRKHPVVSLQMRR
jgi:hypothetical protein